MPDTFAQTVRMIWIDMVVAEEGEIGRGEIMRAFGVSLPQASADIKRYLSKNPRRMVYDRSQKRYVVIEGSRPIYRDAARSAVIELVHEVDLVRIAETAVREPSLRLAHVSPSFFGMVRDQSSIEAGEAYGCTCASCGRPTQAPMTMQGQLVWCLYCGLRAGYVPPVEVPIGIFEFSFGVTREETRLIAEALATGGGEAVDSLAIKRGRDLGHVIDLW
jgi:hypothetical protein